MTRRSILPFAALVVGLTVTAHASPADGLIVHEWGTFTSLQDERGNAVGGINADDEPVPGFVHRLDGRMIINARRDFQRQHLIFSKSIPSSHPDVTMRLETPVIYFHPPKGSPPAPVDVAVTFQGGWLTEYYPWAAAELDGTGYDREKAIKVGRFTPSTYGSLTWPGLLVGTNEPGPKTTDRVWLAPRAVPAAAGVTMRGEGKRKEESEKYLFYRGVGHVDSPLRVSRDGETLRLIGDSIAGPVWFVDIRGDGRCAFRTIDLAESAQARASFAAADYRTDTADLRTAMRAALIADGLYADEADAMLNTWEQSYFKNAGTRVFFMVPRAWTDRVLPLTVNSGGDAVPAERMVRTMVGRVELVTPAQRELLQFVSNSPNKEAQLQAYRDLGRFRDALVLAEQARKPTAALAELMKSHFIWQYKLQADPSPADLLSGGG